MAYVSVSSTIHYLNKWCCTVVNWTLGKKLREIWIKTQLSLEKVHVNMSSAKLRPFFRGLDVIKSIGIDFAKKYQWSNILSYTSALWDVLALEELHYIYNVGTGSMVILMGTIYKQAMYKEQRILLYLNISVYPF